MAILWAGQLVFDIVVFVLTVWKSCYIGKLGDRLLVDILLRDGVYFVINFRLTRQILMCPVRRCDVFCVSGHRSEGFLFRESHHCGQNYILCECRKYSHSFGEVPRSRRLSRDNLKSSLLS